MSHVFDADPKLASQLQAALIDKGFLITNPPYTIFQAKGDGASVTFYESGKLMIQGKKSQEIIEFTIEPILGEFSFTYKELDVDRSDHIGVDEAGKGDFFGPLCIAGVFATGEQITALLKEGIKDSKTITDKKAIRLSSFIEKNCQYDVIALFPQKYNELYGKIKNLNHLLAWAHSTVIANLVKKTGCKKVIIDQFGPKHLVASRVHEKKLDIELIQRTKAESDVVVAAASILARVAFLNGMKKLSDKVGHLLPKGASSLVVEVASKLKQQGVPLDSYAKMHFKTADQLS